MKFHCLKTHSSEARCELQHCDSHPTRLLNTPATQCHMCTHISPLTSCIKVLLQNPYQLLKIPYSQRIRLKVRSTSQLTTNPHPTLYAHENLAGLSSPSTLSTMSGFANFSWPSPALGAQPSKSVVSLASSAVPTGAVVSSAPTSKPTVTSGSGATPISIPAAPLPSATAQPSASFPMSHSQKTSTLVGGEPLVPPHKTSTLIDGEPFVLSLSGSKPADASGPRTVRVQITRTLTVMPTQTHTRTLCTGTCTHSGSTAGPAHTCTQCTGSCTHHTTMMNSGHLDGMLAPTTSSVPAPTGSSVMHPGHSVGMSMPSIPVISRPVATTAPSLHNDVKAAQDTTKTPNSDVSSVVFELYQPTPSETPYHRNAALNPPNPSNPPSGGLVGAISSPPNNETIAGIVFGVLASIAIVVVLLACCRKRAKYGPSKHRDVEMGSAGQRVNLGAQIIAKASERSANRAEERPQTGFLPTPTRGGLTRADLTETFLQGPIVVAREHRNRQAQNPPRSDGLTRADLAETFRLGNLMVAEEHRNRQAQNTPQPDQTIQIPASTHQSIRGGRGRNDDGSISPLGSFEDMQRATTVDNLRGSRTYSDFCPLK
jgi:hypothetical protein